MTETVPGTGGAAPGLPPPQAPGPPPPGYVAPGTTVPASPPTLVPAPRGTAAAAPAPLAHPAAATPAGVQPATKSAAWRWVFYALGGFLVGQIAGAIFGLAAGALEGKTSAQMDVIIKAPVPPEWYIISTLLGIWVGFVGAPWLATRTAGSRRFRHDLGVRFRPLDLIGLAVGPLCQLLINLLYLPFRHDISNYNAPTTKLTGGAHGGGIALIVLATALLAPMAEELFFRGLLFRALLRLATPAAGGRARVLGVVGAVVLDGLLFGLAHGEWVQFAGLALFGMVLATMTYRTGRLGMNMCTHASFNLVAVLSVYGVIH